MRRRARRPPTNAGSGSFAAVSSSEHVVAIVNPHACNGAGGRRWPKLEPALRRHWPELEVWMTEASEHATVLAHTALERGATMIISVGGDGTNNEVLAGFLDPETGRNRFPDAVLGVIASGTGGDFQRMFGPLKPLAQVERLAAAKVRTVDYGLARFVDHQGRERLRPFLNMASVGISGLVDRYVAESSRTFGNTMAYLRAALRAISAWSNVKVRMRTSDGRDEELELTLLCLGNGQYFGAGMHACPSAQVDSGTLECVLLQGFSKGKLVGALARSFSGRHIGYHGIASQPVEWVELEPLDDAEVLLDLDGEQPGRLPARFELVPAGLELRLA